MISGKRELAAASLFGLSGMLFDVDFVFEKKFRLTALVGGGVQGVGYRRYVQRHAENMRLVGYVENLADGRVEVVAEGNKSDLEHLLHFLGKGSTHASVASVEAQWAEATGLEGFYVY